MSLVIGGDMLLVCGCLAGCDVMFFDDFIDSWEFFVSQSSQSEHKPFCKRLEPTNACKQATDITDFTANVSSNALCYRLVTRTFFTPLPTPLRMERGWRGYFFSLWGRAWREGFPLFLWVLSHCNSLRLSGKKRPPYQRHKAIYLQTECFTVYYLHNILSFMWDICFFLLTLPSMEEG